MPGGALAIAVVALAAWVLVRVGLGYGAAARRAAGGRALGLLHDREAAFVDALGAVMFPPGGAVPVSGRDAGLVDYLDRFLLGLDRTKRLQIRLLFALIEHATLLFPGPGVGGMRRFSSQDEVARAQILEGWASSRLAIRRLLFQALRAVMTMAYLGSPAVLRSLDLAPLAFDSPVVEADWLYPPIGQGPEAIPYSAEDRTEPSAGLPLDIRGPLHPAFAAPTQRGGEEAR